MSKIGKKITLRLATGRELTFKEVDDNFEVVAWTPVTDKQFGNHPALTTEETYVEHVLKRLDALEKALGVGTTPTPTPTTYEATYVTTAADFTTKCGAGTSGATQSASVSGYSTPSGAAAAAKAAAIAKITCPIVVTPPPATGAKVAYHGGISSPTATSTDVAALAKESWAAASRTISFLGDGSYPCFAEDASLGIRSKVYDGNNFEVQDDLPRTQLTIDGVLVNVYTYVNAVYDTITLRFEF